MTDKPLFTDIGLDQDLADALSDRGIVHPFAIQELTLPLALKGGHDIIGQARTGTGKTLAFGLPLLQGIDPTVNKTQAMVIVPTRELCVQVADDLTVGAGRGITSIAVYGGVGYEEQIEALTTGVHVVVGTPGRTIDHLNRGNLDVSNIHTIVLDEADEMLDMGFLPDVERLLTDVPTDRQTLLFSATMPTEIVKLARRFMDKPTFMRADETLHETAPEVDQHFFLVHRMDKPRVLARLLQMPGRGGAFVFCRTKRMCDRLVRELEDLNLSAIAVHGDLRQASRERNLDKFRDGKADVLVATEVAARGLDVSNVSHVVNYDCPDDEKMYLHRIGRTARAGESGVAVTFAEFNEVDRVNVIRKRVEADEELVEIFSTSDELTKLFDLPEATPWDDLGGDDSSRGSKSRGSRSDGRKSDGRKSDGRKSGGSKSRDRKSSNRRKSASSGSNRSSGRDSDRPDRDRERRRSSASSDQARTTRRSSRSSSDRTRSRSRSRTSVQAVVADAVASREQDGADDSSRDTSKRDDSRSRGRSRDRSASRQRANEGGSSSKRDRGSRSDGSGPTRDRGSRSTNTSSSDDGGSSNNESRSRDNARKGRDKRGDNGGSRRTTGGARPRSRRSRSGSSSSAKSSGRGSSDDSSGSSRSRDRDNRSGSSGKGSNRTSNRNSSKGSGSKSKTSSKSGSKSNSKSGSGSGRGRNNQGSSNGPATTSRGDDARGDGRPRPRRRVAVDHLP